MSETPAPAVVLVGLNGFGRQHLANLHRLAGEGRLRFAAGIDHRDPGPEVVGEGVPVFASLGEAAVAGIHPDVVIVSTPIATHAELGHEALALGADLLVEKPPTATLEQFHALERAAADAGRLVQVGFQSLGSHALPAIAWLLASGRIGTLRAVGATGAWLRTEGYYARAPWAGKRVLDGVQVVDGVATNPLAHAVQTALVLAGARGPADVEELELELFHAHAIEADDTTTIRLRTAAGIPLTCALTLCAPVQEDPFITLFCTEGTAVLHYTRDELTVTGPDGAVETTAYGRTNLLEDLLDVRAGRSPALLSPLASAGAFMRVLEAIRTAPDPSPIAAEHLEQHGEGAERHPVVPGIAGYLDRAVKSQASFASLGAPWAGPAAVSGSLEVAGTVVAEVRTGADIAPTNSPRPFLHPVRTLAGTVVTAQQPLDHTWHLGAGVALQDVDGSNYWGGRTYTRAAGRYVWRADHGRIATESQSIAPFGGGSRLAARLRWDGYDGGAQLAEERTVTAVPAAGGWEFGLDFALSPAGTGAVSLGSPGSNGRDRGGYGGFFWRLPELEDVEVFTAQDSGEDAVHGSVAPWLAVSAVFRGPDGPGSGSGSGSEATLVFAAPDDDPWFVRCSGYPGIGRSIAWEEPVVASPGAPVSRSVRVLVLDGRLDRAAVEALDWSGVAAGARR
ncbi:DUF6807 family protein [Zafaria sp. Z1313]|uniref:DUF6807 family protein n=1 Tax=Zafaria sp. Z1313 TaxID=3423202 RepID=UPI003D301F03